MKLYQQPIKPIQFGKIGAPYGKKGKGWSWNIIDNKGTWKKGKIDGFGMHTGVDFPCMVGTPCLAVINGTIIYIDYNKIMGLFIVLQSMEKVNITYAHLSNVLCEEGAKVKQGDFVCITGNTGNVYPRPSAEKVTAGAHLHISFRDDQGNWFEPSFKN